MRATKATTDVTIRDRAGRGFGAPVVPAVRSARANVAAMRTTRAAGRAKTPTTPIHTTIIIR